MWQHRSRNLIFLKFYADIIEIILQLKKPKKTRTHAQHKQANILVSEYDKKNPRRWRNKFSRGAFCSRAAWQIKVTSNWQTKKKKKPKRSALKPFIRVSSAFALCCGFCFALFPRQSQRGGRRCAIKNCLALLSLASLLFFLFSFFFCQWKEEKSFSAISLRRAASRVGGIDCDEVKTWETFDLNMCVCEWDVRVQMGIDIAGSIAGVTPEPDRFLGSKIIIN